MNPIYLFNPDLFKSYLPPHICSFCGQPTTEGEHQRFSEHPDGSLYWGCRVPMLCDQPKPLGRINSEEVVFAK